MGASYDLTPKMGVVEQEKFYGVNGDCRACPGISSSPARSTSISNCSCPVEPLVSVLSTIIWTQRDRVQFSRITPPPYDLQSRRSPRCLCLPGGSTMTAIEAGCTKGLAAGAFSQRKLHAPEWLHCTADSVPPRGRTKLGFFRVERLFSRPWPDACIACCPARPYARTHYLHPA